MRDLSASVPATSTLRDDLLASVVVFLVALPLCMGVAIASGAPVAAGLITGIIGGVVAGALAGCPLQVSGPAAGLTVIVFEIVDRLGLEQLGLVVLIAGALQVLAGIGRLGQWFRAVSPAVIKGMLSGIGFLILAGQLHVMLDEKPPGSGAVNLDQIPEAIQHALTPHSIDPVAPFAQQRDELQRSRAIVAQHAALRQRLIEATSQSNMTDEVWSTLADELSAIAKRLTERTVPHNSPAAIEFTDATQQALADMQAGVAALGAHDPIATDLALQSAGESLAQWHRGLKHPHLALMLGLLTIVVIVMWQEFAPQRLKVLPPALAAVVVATAVAAVFQWPVYYVEVPANLLNDIHLPSVSLLNTVSWKTLFQYGLLTAIVASAETLLCAAAVDQMQTGPRTKYDQELFAQGVGNVLCGLVGALPMTGVIVRSSANVLAGGKTRLSTMLHGVWLMVFVAGMAVLLRQIPTSCLAAILVYTGYKLIDIKAMRELIGYGWGEVVIYFVTIATIVFADLLSGVILGISLSALKLLYTFSHLDAELTHDAQTKSAKLRLRGAATFVRLPQLAAELEKVPKSFDLHVDLSELDYIDHACLELLMSWGAGHQATGGSLVVDWESLHGRFRRERPSNPNALAE